MDRERTSGVVYPIPHDIVNRMLGGGKTVFVKSLPWEKSQLEVGHKVLFYASHRIRAIVGEGTIRDVEYLTPNETLKKHKESLFLTPEELSLYTSKRGRAPSKRLLVLSLEKIKKFPKPVPYGKHITMAGEYLTKQQILKFEKEASGTLHQGETR